jgi:hypothetical protein
MLQAEKAKPTQVVVEPDQAAETPLGMTPWSATGQGHDRDEAAGGEAEDSTVPPASPEEVYSAMSVEDRIAMKKDFAGKGLIRRGEIEAFCMYDAPDPLLLVPHRTFGSRGKHTDPALASGRNTANGPLKAINPFRAKLAGCTGLRCFAPRILG